MYTIGLMLEISDDDGSNPALVQALLWKSNAYG